MPFANQPIPLPKYFLSLRLTQFALAFVVLIFIIVPIALWSGYYSFGLGIFTCIATIIITGYWWLATRRKPSAYNRWAHLVLDIWAVLWWLISFSTLAQLAAAFAAIAGVGDELAEEGVDTSGTILSPTTANTCRAMTAIAAFLGAVEFILFLTTLITYSTHLHRQRRAEFRPLYANNNNNNNPTMMNNMNNGGMPQQYPQQQTPPASFPNHNASHNGSYNNGTYNNYTNLNNGNGNGMGMGMGMGPGHMANKEGPYVSVERV